MWNLHKVSGRRRTVVLLLCVALVLLGQSLVPRAHAADPLPSPAAATALPTVQINGVVWQQLVWNNTVFVGGKFSNARPAGAAAGTNLTARSNMLAFDIATGALKSGFVANTNGQVLGMAMAPDASRLYIVGEFTTVNGVSANRIAALDPATGRVDTAFKAGTNYRVRGIVVTSSTVYVGGSFSSANGVGRTNLAAFQRSSGALTSWSPTATGGQVMALAYVPGSQSLAVGGAFSAINGTQALGSGAVAVSDGRTRPFPLNQVVRNSGDSAAIYSLSTDGSKIYGVGYVYGPGGNFEGSFATDEAGNIAWLNDSWGDQYDIGTSRGIVYAVGHVHNDANLESGIPEVFPRKHWHSTAQTSYATGTLQPSNFKGSSESFAGKPAPTLLHWWPEWTTGSATSARMAGWTVEGNDKYVVVGGEFTAVNGLKQQGIVRFTYRDVQQSKEPPRLSGSGFVPDVTSPAANTAQIAFPANWDRDDAVLRYTVEREGKGTVAELSQRSHSNIRPMRIVVERNVPAGAQRYRIKATDSTGYTVTGDWKSVTVGSTGSLGSYRSAVLADSPTTYHRLGEASGTVVDSAYTYDGSGSTGITRSVPGALKGDGNTAYQFNGSQTVWTATTLTPPRAVSTEAWFKTTSKSGGLIVGFGNSQSGASGTNNYVTFLGNDGKVRFGVRDLARRVITSPKAYNDGAWHHVVGTVDWAGGQRLYVDGALVASNAAVKHGRDVNGYWRIGGDNLAGWSGDPQTDSLTGAIDEVATYQYALPQDRVQAHYTAGKNG